MMKKNILKKAIIAKSEKMHLSLIAMIFISFVAQILSLVKSSIVAGDFGTSGAMDAYNLANNITTFAFSFVASGISTIIIPEYANARNKKAVDTFITVIYGALAFVVLLMGLFRMPLVCMFGHRGDIFVNTTANILIILLFAQYCSSIANITVAYFQCEGQYNTPKIISLIFQLFVIVSLFLFDNITIVQYTLIVGGGMIFNAVFDTAIALKRGWRYCPALIFDEDSKLLFKRFMPIVLSTGVYRLSLMIDTTISSFLDEGKLSMMSYSTQISAMISAVLVGNLTIYLYPKITKRITENGYQKQFWKSTASLHAIVCLISAGFLTVGYEGVSLLFEHGEFTEDASKIVFIGAAIYVVGQQTSVIRDLLYRYFYAIGDTNVPSTNSVIVSILNILISLLLVSMIGFYGIIIGTVLASLISLIIIMFRFKKKIGFDEKIFIIIGRYMISVVIFIVTVVLVYLTKYCISISDDLISILVFGIETVIIYVVLSLLFNRKTIANFKNL